MGRPCAHHRGTCLETGASCRRKRSPWPSSSSCTYARQTRRLQGCCRGSASRHHRDIGFSNRSSFLHFLLRRSDVADGAEFPEDLSVPTAQFVELPIGVDTAPVSVAFCARLPLSTLVGRALLDDPNARPAHSTGSPSLSAASSHSGKCSKPMPAAFTSSRLAASSRMGAREKTSSRMRA